MIATHIYGHKNSIATIKLGCAFFALILYLTLFTHKCSQCECHVQSNKILWTQGVVEAVNTRYTTGEITCQVGESLVGLTHFTPERLVAFAIEL